MRATAARYKRASARDRQPPTTSGPRPATASRPLRRTCLFAARCAPFMLHKQAHPNRAAFPQPIAIRQVRLQRSLPHLGFL